MGKGKKPGRIYHLDNVPLEKKHGKMAKFKNSRCDISIISEKQS